MGCVYCATNKANGKVYIGKTINTLAMRMMEHKSNAFGGCYWEHFIACTPEELARFRAAGLFKY